MPVLISIKTQFDFGNIAHNLKAAFLRARHVHYTSRIPMKEFTQKQMPL